MPLKQIYDIGLDAMRDVTDDDVSAGLIAIAAFGKWREAEKALMEVTLEMGQGKRPLSDLAALIRSAAK